MNPFKSNGIFHSYQFGHSISVLMVVGDIFHFLSNFNVMKLCKQSVGTLIYQIPCSAVSDQGLHCLLESLALVINLVSDV